MVSVYVRLLSLYPSSFRARFGDEMVQYLRDESAHGRRMHWTRTLADLLRSALTERWKDNNMRAKLGAGLLILFVTFLVARVVIGSHFTVQTAMIIGIQLGIVAILLGVGSLLGRRVRGAEYDYALRRLRWWWIPAGILGALEVVFSVGQLIRDPKATNLFAMLVLCGFAALVFGGMTSRNRRTGNYMIAAGVLPGIPLFWLIFPTVLAFTVIVNALADNVRIAHPRAAV